MTLEPIKRGRKPSPIEVFEQGPLDLKDLVTLSEQGPARALPCLKELRARHHRAAELLAVGLKEVEVSRITGYSQSYLSTLKNSPSFADLIEHYGARVRQGALDLSEKFKDLTEDLLEILAQQIVDHWEGEEPLAPDFVLKALQAVADRSGYAPIHRSETRSYHATLTGADLRAMKEEVNGQQRGVVVHSSRRSEAAPEERQPEVAELDTGDRGTPVGETLEGESPAQDAIIVRHPSGGPEIPEEDWGAAAEALR